MNDIKNKARNENVRIKERTKQRIEKLTKQRTSESKIRLITMQ